MKHKNGFMIIKKYIIEKEKKHLIKRGLVPIWAENSSRYLQLPC